MIARVYEELIANELWTLNTDYLVIFDLAYAVMIGGRERHM